MDILTVASKEKFEPLSGLPESFAVDDEIRARAIMPEDYEPLATIIVNDPDIKQFVTWASLVEGPDDIRLALESRTHGTLLGRYALELTEQSSVFGYVGIFPGKQAEEYGFGSFIERSMRRSGAAGRAITTLMNHAIRTLSPEHLYVQIAPENTPSVAAALKHGFKPAEMVWDPDLQLQEQRFRLEIPSGQAA